MEPKKGLGEPNSRVLVTHKNSPIISLNLNFFNFYVWNILERNACYNHKNVEDSKKNIKAS